MKSHSIACLFLPSPPPHQITAAATTTNSLFTGSSSGSIIHWSLLDPNNPHPTSLLSAHSSPISSFSTLPSSLLLSSCLSSLISLWSLPSLRCLRRRKLPPWSGSPSLSSPLSSRHVALLCHLPISHSYSILILDSWSLNLLQTVFHGNLSIGSVVSLRTLFFNEDRKQQDLVLVDRAGRVQIVAVVEREVLSEGSFSSESRGSGFDDDDDGGILAVDVSRDGRVLAVVLKGGGCVLRSVLDGSIVGEVSLAENLVCESEIVGVGFVDSDDDGGRKIVVWSKNGAAVVYDLFGLAGETIKFRPSFEVPALPVADAKTESVIFRQFNSSLLRIQSVCIEIGGSFISKPYITVWSLSQSEPIEVLESNRPFSSAKLIGEGAFPGDLIETVERTGKSLQHDLREVNPGSFSSGNNEKIVSSSMVLSDEIFAPYAVVYGFYSGQIEVLEFSSLSPRENSEMDIVNHQIYPQFSERFFSGHTGAILCLAAHRMVVQSESHSFSRALISGSTDCTVRIWDLDSGSPISVMHHHVAPVQQIILPPPGTFHPWNNCFISVSEDCGVVLVSLETLRVERMFPGHPSYPSMVAWDGVRGYIACLCRNLHSSSAATSVFYLWDVKTGARERIISGTASHTMFDNFCYGIKKNSMGGSLLGGNTSASALLLPVFKDIKSRGKTEKRADNKGGKVDKTPNSFHIGQGIQPNLGTNDSGHDLAGNSSARQNSSQKLNAKRKVPIKCFCPFPGIASLKFDLSSLMSPPFIQRNDHHTSTNPSGHETSESNFQHRPSIDSQGTESRLIKESLEGYLLRFSLCFLHQWDVDRELDKLLMEEMNVFKPEVCHVASGILGDRGTVTLNFPGLQNNLELWKSSSEFCAMRSLAIVSLAQRMITVTHTCSKASSALAAFYTRNFAERFPQMKPPSLQLLVSFWQDPSEHVRMAARSLFHCSAPRAIPHALRGVKVATPRASPAPSVFEENGRYSNGSNSELDRHLEDFNVHEAETSSIVTWLESFDFQEWVLWIGGTSQDAMASNIIVAAALVVWYPSLVKKSLAELVVNQLVKLVMSMNDRYSSTAAELLAEGMVSTWSICLGPELPHLIGDVLFQTECLSGTPMNKAMQNTAVAITIREALVEILLPSLAMADIVGFLNVIQGQIWATSSDSPVHLVSLKTLIRVVRGSPKSLAPYLAKAVHYVLQTMDPGNLVMRKACLNSSMIVLKEIARVFPMVALNETSTRLAVGDAIGDIHSATIQIFDIESVTKVKILDASAPPGLPSFLEETMKSKVTTTITALTFSPDGEGLIAFSTNGLMIRWWSLGTGWWEKFSRNLVPVPCTKLIFVPPWEGFSPNSSRSSIMADIVGHGEQVKSQDKTAELDDASMMDILIQNIDLSYRLEWVDGRKVTLIHHGQEVGTFQL